MTQISVSNYHNRKGASQRKELRVALKRDCQSAILILLLNQLNKKLLPQMIFNIEELQASYQKADPAPAPKSNTLAGENPGSLLRT